MSEPSRSDAVEPRPPRRRWWVLRLLLDYPAEFAAWNERKGFGWFLDRFSHLSHGNLVLLGAFVLMVVWLVLGFVLGLAGLAVGAAIGAVSGSGHDLEYLGLKTGLYAAGLLPLGAIAYLVWGAVVWSLASNLIVSDRVSRGRRRR
ncbi:hypothetical protein [Isoptericola croceus]|uniref:hypothetical protein n=1 Tax=Isoptericola croceus TaxID=3031406 RepID=UPI0023F708EF|nr:hypothetical protein [Isoptericola croceus]